ncbi:MAG: hypothetical protein IKE77_08540 [Erysipelotrichaceae bacterium]|nr:hypothetical protein [Erysipelotrichaceae bacterium]
MLIIIILILIYLFLIKPGRQTRREMMKPFEKVYLTHRGFYDNRTIPENSLPAFRKTVRNDLGTELDVQLTKDGRLVVFHDRSLKRMCGIDRVLTECTYDELMQYPLLNTGVKIPLFEEVLAVLKPDTPLIIEIKPEGDAIRTCEETVQLMKSYDYTYIMESFNPLVVKYLKERHPEIIRGQLAYNMVGDENNRYPFIVRFACTNLLTNLVTRPDFIAYDVHSPLNLSFLLCSKLFRAECVAWTVQNEKDLTHARKYYQQVIFDSFIPADITTCD